MKTKLERKRLKGGVVAYYVETYGERRSHRSAMVRDIVQIGDMKDIFQILAHYILDLKMNLIHLSPEKINQILDSVYTLVLGSGILAASKWSRGENIEEGLLLSYRQALAEAIYKLGIQDEKAIGQDIKAWTLNGSMKAGLEAIKVRDFVRKTRIDKKSRVTLPRRRDGFLPGDEVICIPRENKKWGTYYMVVPAPRQKKAATDVNVDIERALGLLKDFSFNIVRATCPDDWSMCIEEDVDIVVLLPNKLRTYLKELFGDFFTFVDILLSESSGIGKRVMNVLQSLKTTMEKKTESKGMRWLQRNIQQIGRVL